MQEHPGTKRFTIIYSARNVLKHEDGLFIDTFDEVVRINDAPREGLGKSPSDWFPPRNESLVIALNPNVAGREKPLGLRHFRRLTRRTVSNWTMIEPQPHCRRLIGVGDNPNRWCTSGFLAVLWAMERCDAVTVFGANQNPCYLYEVL